MLSWTLSSDRSLTGGKLPRIIINCKEFYQNLSLYLSESQIGVREGEMEVNLPTDGQGEEEGEDQLDQPRHVGNYSWSELRRD